MKFEAGVDLDGNGILSDAEVSPTLTRNVCNGINGSPGGPGDPGPPGANGKQTLVRASEAYWWNSSCSSAGGTKFEVGTDWNQNNYLDSWEVLQTRDVCNGTNGTNGSNGSDGVADYWVHEVDVTVLSGHHDKCTADTILHWLEKTAYFSAPCTSAVFRYCKDRHYKVGIGPLEYNSFTGRAAVACAR
jgi:hypothetical protein